MSVRLVVLLVRSYMEGVLLPQISMLQKDLQGSIGIFYQIMHLVLLYFLTQQTYRKTSQL